MASPSRARQISSDRTQMLTSTDATEDKTGLHPGADDATKQLGGFEGKTAGMDGGIAGNPFDPDIVGGVMDDDETPG